MTTEPDVHTKLETLANAVRAELAVNGLPVVPDHLNGGSPPGTAGAQVYLDLPDNRGVLATWAPHFILESAVHAGDPDGPAARLLKTITATMLDAMTAILSAAGFDVVRAGPGQILITGRHAVAPWWDWFEAQLTGQR